MNIAEILKDCTKGMELDCTCADNVVFDKIIEYEQIKCVIGESHESLILDKYGRLRDICCPKCVIFPKGKTTWEGFQRPFKDGDILAYNSPVGTTIFIHRNKKGEHTYKTSFYVGLNARDKLLVYDKYTLIALNRDCNTRLATEEEKQKLFQAIKDNGYKWNPETKTLEKLEVNKFDITTLKPFDRVLVRGADEQVWTADLFSHILNDNSGLKTVFVCIGHCAYKCIPYNDDTKHLLGTTNDCDECYKTWE